MRALISTLLVSIVLGTPAFGQTEAFDSYFLVVGPSYNFAPELPPLPNLVRDCEALRDHLIKEGVGERLVALCGGEASWMRIMNIRFQQMRTGDNLFVFWAGHGLRDDEGDACFLPSSAYNEAMGGGSDCIHPDLLVTYLKRDVLPEGANIIIATEASHPGNYNGQSLQGPLHSDFERSPEVISISSAVPVEGSKLLPGVQKCFGRKTAVNSAMTYQEFAACLSRMPELRVTGARDRQHEVIWYKEAGGTNEARELNVPLLAGVEAVTILSLGCGILSWAEAGKLRQGLEADDPTAFYPTREEYDSARGIYNNYRTTNTVCTATGIVAGSILGFSLVFN